DEFDFAGQMNQSSRSAKLEILRPDRIRFARKGTFSGFLLPCVLRLDHARLPRTAALKPIACQFVQARQIHHSPFPAATLPHVCPISGVCVWSSPFAILCAFAVRLPSTIPPF